MLGYLLVGLGGLVGRVEGGGVGGGEMEMAYIFRKRKAHHP